MAAIFDLLETQMSKSLYTSSTELLDPENVVKVFWIVLLSSI